MKRFEERDLGKERIFRTLAKMSGGDPHITVGIHGKDNKPYKRGDGGPVKMAQLGAFHEFGTLDRFGVAGHAGTKGVPRRSFLRDTLDENSKDYGRDLERGIKRLLDGQTTITRMLGLVGEQIVADSKKRIVNGIGPALRPATIASKGSSKPLVDTGQLSASITYEVRDK